MERALRWHWAMTFPKAIFGIWPESVRLFVGYKPSHFLNPASSYIAYVLLSEALEEESVWEMGQEEFINHLDHLAWVLAGMEQVR